MKRESKKEKNLKDKKNECEWQLSSWLSALLTWPRPAPETSVDVPDFSGQVSGWWLRMKGKSQNRSQAK